MKQAGSFPFQRLTLCAVVLFWATLCPVAQAQDTKRYEIDAGDLRPALRLFARQSDQQILYTPAIVAGRTTQGFRGYGSAEDALAQVLAGTGLTYAVAGSGTLLVVEETTVDPARVNNEGESGVPGNSAVLRRVPALEEIVVTAQRRQELLQDVPVAVTALSASRLEAVGAASSVDLTTITPGLSMTRTVAIAAPTIRGIGGRNTAASDEGTVPIYIDGVYQSMMQTGFFSLSGIERIEVLKGPQGTLFGRNAMGGAINVITTPPSQAPGATLGISLARFDARGVDFYGNVPLGDTLAANIAIHADEDGGYVKDLGTGRTSRAAAASFSARAKALWSPAANVQITAGAAHLDSSDDTAIAAFPLDGNTVALQFDPAVRLARPLQTDTDFRPEFKVDQDQGFVGAEFRLQPFIVNLLVSYEETAADIQTDYDATAYPVGYVVLPYGSRALTSELRFASMNDSRLRWIAGLFYYSQEGYQGKTAKAYRLTFSPTGTVTQGIIDTTVDSLAGFAEATYAVTDRLSVTAGVRHTTEERGLKQQRSLTPAGLPPVPPAPFASGSSRFSNTSPRATVQYAFTDHIRTYLTYSEGFKSGVYNGSSFIAPGVPPDAVNPEILKAWEAGLKMELTPAVRFNVAVFRYDHQDLQVSTRSPTGNTILQNAASSVNHGGEAELTWALGNRWSVGAGLSLQRARFNSFPAAQTFTRRPDGNGNITDFADVSGKHLPRAPDQAANLSTDYSLPAFGGELLLSANYFWTSDYYWDLGNNFDNRGSHGNLNARAAWTSAERNHRVILFGTNLTDSRTPIVIQPSGGGTYASQVKPAVVGIRYEYFWR